MKGINSLSTVAKQTDNAPSSESSGESKDAASDFDGDRSVIEPFLQLRMRSKNEVSVARLPNGEYLGECNRCNAGTVFKTRKEAELALLDHRCFRI